MEIKLPDYKKIASKVKRRKVEVFPEEIEEALIFLQKSRPKFSSKNQPAKKGDFVEINFQSPQIEGGLEIRDAFILGKGKLIPGFEENLEGMEAGQEKEFSLIFPGNHYRRDLAGRKINFKVKMRSIQEVEFPEIDDQLARNLGRFENLTALKESLKEGLILEKEQRESQRLRGEILEKIAQESSFEIPEILIESEKKRLLEDLKMRISQNLQMNFEDYLKKINKAEKELLDSFLPEAQKRVKNTLILREISKREGISVSPEEVEEEINKILKYYPEIGKTLDLEKLKIYTEEVIRNEKTFQSLERLANSA